MNDFVLPGTDEQAKAIQKASDFGTTVIQEVGQLTRYIGKILGTIPEDVVGMVIGDPLHHIRVSIAEKLYNRVGEIHKGRGVEATEPVSPSLAIPLIRAAYDESRPELQEMWAQLIAAAMDSTRSSRVRQSFIETVKRLDPLDARVLRSLYEASGTLSPNSRDYFANRLSVTVADITISVQNLSKLKCVFVPPGQGSDPANFFISTYGKELIKVCSNGSILNCVGNQSLVS